MRSRDEITGDLKSTITHTITDISSTEIGIRLAVLGKSDVGYQSYDRAWDMITNGIWRSTPNDGMGIRAPLAVGKSWPVKATEFNSSNGVSLKRTGTAKVTAQESLTTRAGTFDTYKIEIAIEFSQCQRYHQEISVRAADLVRAVDQSLGEARECQPFRRPCARPQHGRAGRVRAPLD